MEIISSKLTQISAWKLLLILFIFSIPLSFISASDQVCLNLAGNLGIGRSQSKVDVLNLQNFLYQKGYISVTPTGYFGKLTELGVKNFQIANSISVTGTVGPLTRSKISSLSCQIAKKVEPVQTALVIKAIIPEVKATTINLPYETNNFSDWIKLNGYISTSTNLIIRASEDAEAAIAVTPKFSHLTDYKYNVNVLIKRGTIILVGRYVNIDNFLGCVFSGRSVSIIQKINGSKETVASTYIDELAYRDFYFTDTNLTMSLKGNTVGCTIVGNEPNVVFSNVDKSLMKGSIGLEIWYGANGVADIEVKKISITNI